MIVNLIYSYRAREWIGLAICALFLSGCNTIGMAYSGENSPSTLGVAFLLVTLILFAIVFAAALFAADLLFGLIGRRRKANRCAGKSKEAGASYEGRAEASGPKGTLLDAITPSFSKKGILLFSGIMLALWLPWVMVGFPAHLNNDTVYQLFQIYPHHEVATIPFAERYEDTGTDAWLIDHHPIFTTLLYGAFGFASDMLTGSMNAGIFVFSIIQSIAFCIVFVGCIAYAKREGCPSIACFVIYALLCIAPFIPVWASAMLKDSTFALFFVLYVAMTVNVIKTKANALGSRRFAACYIVVAILMCLTKKTGIFIVVISALIGALIYRKHAKAYLLQAGCSVVLMALVLPLIVFPLLNVLPGGAQEALSPMLHQTARYATLHPEDMTQDERRAIEGVADLDEMIANYDESKQDSVKYYFDLGATPEDVSSYLQAYVSMGIKHPEVYLASTMKIACSYLCPVSEVTLWTRTANISFPTEDGDYRDYYYQPNELADIRLGINDGFILLTRLPIVNLLCSKVLYDLWLPAILLFCLWRRRIDARVLWAPMAIMLAFCIIGPVVDTRYMAPFLFASPLLVCMSASLIAKNPR